MTRAFDIVGFDLDGTLLDTSASLTPAVNYTLAGADATAKITGLEKDHPLFNAVATLVEERQAELASTPA